MGETLPAGKLWEAAGSLGVPSPASKVTWGCPLGFLDPNCPKEDKLAPTALLCMSGWACWKGGWQSPCELQAAGHMASNPCQPPLSRKP